MPDENAPKTPDAIIYVDNSHAPVISFDIAPAHGVLAGTVQVELAPGFRGGRYVLPSPLLKDQWALLFLKSQGGRWVAPPVGRVVETPYKGLTFYPGYNIVLEDAAPGLSWSYVLDSLKLLIETRKQIISGFLPQLRAAKTKEQRDRINMAIEMQVKEQLGLPVP